MRRRWATRGNPLCGAGVPEMRVLGLITRAQFVGWNRMICGGDACSAEYYLREDEIEYRKPH